MRLIFSFITCLICFGCFSGSTKSSKPVVLVTIPPYAHFVEALVADHALVEIFVPPGANPHAYEPTPEQVRHFIQAKVWFRTGDLIEQKMVEFLKHYPIKIIDLSENCALLEADNNGHGHDEKDLHLWMNPLIVADQVEKMSLVLSKKFPEIAAQIQDNSQKLISQLKQTDLMMGSKLQPFRHRHLLLSHPALGYFCQRYGLHQQSIEVEGKDPLPQNIAVLMNDIKAHQIPVIWIEPQYNNKGAFLIAEQLQLPLETLDPYAKDYFGMLTHLTELIVKYYDLTD